MNEKDWKQTRRPVSARALYLELSARGIDVFTTGGVPKLELSCTEIARLMQRVRENRVGLREILAGEADPDVQAVRREAAA